MPFDLPVERSQMWAASITRVGNINQHHADQRWIHLWNQIIANQSFSTTAVWNGRFAFERCSLQPLALAWSHALNFSSLHTFALARIRGKQRRGVDVEVVLGTMIRRNYSNVYPNLTDPRSNLHDMMISYKDRSCTRNIGTNTSVYICIHTKPNIESTIFFINQLSIIHTKNHPISEKYE